jgi:hypothetical protein
VTNLNQDLTFAMFFSVQVDRGGRRWKEVE